tara:strand:- start:23644 stop:23883 length:240 start_codon:yes stop_codon:yes gene_type:complete
MGKVKSELWSEPDDSVVQELRLEPEMREDYIEELSEHDMAYLSLDNVREIAKQALMDSYKVYTDSEVRWEYNKTIGRHE